MSSRGGFFTDAMAYERLMGRWSRLVGEIFLDWIAVPKDLRWIDIGCGTGAFTEELIKHCSPAAVVAIDPSADQLAFARDRPGLEGAEFCVGDAQHLPFVDESFDIAVMALVVHFVPDPAKAIAEMARVVRRGGGAVTYVWDYAIGGSPTAPLAAAMKSLGLESSPPPSAKATSLQALQELWRSSGLHEIETRVIRIAVTFPTFDEFWGSMSLRARLREQTCIEADGRVVYEACANAIMGRAAA